MGTLQTQRNVPQNTLALEGKTLTSRLLTYVRVEGLYHATRVRGKNLMFRVKHEGIFYNSRADTMHVYRQVLSNNYC